MLPSVPLSHRKNWEAEGAAFPVISSRSPEKTSQYHDDTETSHPHPDVDDENDSEDDAEH